MDFTTLYGYVCFYRSKRVEVTASTTYEAQQKAAALLKAKKPYEVSVCLAEKAGEPIVHDADI
jgi:hypothetical protein